MARIEIIGGPHSSYVWVVRMVCEEKQVPYDLTLAAPQSPESRAIHPLGKIPSMRHGEVTLFESKAIATYIDKTFSGRKLIPEDALGAAEVEQWVGRRGYAGARSSGFYKLALECGIWHSYAEHIRDAMKQMR